MSLPQKLPYELHQTQWASQLNPLLANLLVQGMLLNGQNLATGVNVINHKLGRAPQGWFLVAPQAAAIVYQNALQPNPTLHLTLTSDADVLTSIWVF